jgi:nicotinamidase-related amidase
VTRQDRSALLLVDVLNDFRHEDGEQLLASFSSAASPLELLLRIARDGHFPVVFANDNNGVWDGDSTRLVKMALAGPAGELVERIRPGPDDRFIVKPRYSAFDLTPLELVLSKLEIDRLVLAGAATEMCVVQTATDAHQRGFEVVVAEDACAALDEANSTISLAYLARVLGVRIASAATAFDR